MTTHGKTTAKETSAPMELSKEEEEKLRESPVHFSSAEAAGVEQKHKAKHIAAGAVPQFATADAFFAMLARAKADNFAIQGPPSDTPIWICNKTDKIVDVYQGLIKRNVSAVPVLLKDGKYYGFLDMMDIVRYVIKHFGKESLTSGGEQKTFMDLVAEEKGFKEKTVNDLMEYPYAPASRSAYHPITSGYSAMAVVEPLAREKALHRVAIISPDRKIINLVTASQVLMFLHDNSDLLGAIGSKTLTLCKGLIKPVLSVTEESTAIDAFNLMLANNEIGVAVVRADNGRLRGNLSLRDLKLCGADLALFWRLHQTVKNFIVKLRHEFQARHERPPRAVYVLESASLIEVIRTFVKEKIHRVYIVDSHGNKKPIGVVTLQDVLREIIDA